MRTILLALLALPILAAPAAQAEGFGAIDAVYLDARSHVFVAESASRDAFGFPTGIDGELQLDLFGRVDLTAQTGFLYGVAGDVTNWYIPFNAGLVYDIKEGSKTPFAGASFGVVIGHVPDNTEVETAFDIYGGYKMGAFQIKLGYGVLSTEFIKETSTLYAALGFNIR